MTQMTKNLCHNKKNKTKLSNSSKLMVLKIDFFQNKIAFLLKYTKYHDNYLNFILFFIFFI